jgi:hypothetical protein
MISAITGRTAMGETQSKAAASALTGNAPFELSPKNRIIPALLVVLGIGATWIGLYAAPEHTWPTLLLNGFYVMSLGLSGMLFIASQRLSGARWSASLRRIPEALMLVVPLAAVLMMVLFFGRHTLYPWSRPEVFAHEPAIAGRVQYLDVAFVFGRMAVALALWGLFAWLFRRASLAQDKDSRSSLLYHRRLNGYAAAFLLVFAVSFTTGSYDWLLSLDPHWYSTMFSVYLFIGTFVQGIAAVTLAAVILRERGFLRSSVSDAQLHDLGKMLFAFSTFWAYIWTCQYLLIWYGNIPEEITHYVTRTRGSWLPLFLLNPLLNWVLPFGLLLSARAKRRPRVLKGVCVLLLVGHWLDLYLLVMPEVWRGPRIGVVDLLVTAGYLALIYAAFLRGLLRAPLVPLNDPILMAERQHHEAS